MNLLIILSRIYSQIGDVQFTYITIALTSWYYSMFVTVKRNVDGFQILVRQPVAKLRFEGPDKKFNLGA